MVRLCSVSLVLRYLFSSRTLSSVSQTSCARLAKVFIVVALCEVGLYVGGFVKLSVGMRQFSVHCRSQFVVVSAYQTV